MFQAFFLHPKLFKHRGGGIFGTTQIEPREDLGDVIIETATNKSYILKSDFIIVIPSKSSRSYKLKYSLLNPTNEFYDDWRYYRDQMILGIRYATPYDGEDVASRTPGYQEQYAPLYSIRQEDFELTLADIFNEIAKEQEKLKYVGARGNPYSYE